MTKSHNLRKKTAFAVYLFSFLLATIPGAPSWAADKDKLPPIPSTLVISGLVISGQSGIAIQPGQDVIAVVTATQEQVGVGAINDRLGNYALSMSKPSSFNGTDLSLRFVANGQTYALLENGKPAHLAYTGKGLLPVMVKKNLTLSRSPLTGAAQDDRQSGKALAAESVQTRGCPAEIPKCDVFGNGRFDDKTIEFIRTSLHQHPPDPRADVNGDGVVNSKDLIDAMRALDALSHGKVQR